MREYGKVYSTFWSSVTTGSLSDDGKILALYLMTCSHSTIAGVFRLPDGYVSEDLGWVTERVREGFAELLAKGFANRCETTKWVWVRKHLEWNKPENPNQRKSAAKIAAGIPRDCCWGPEFSRTCDDLLGVEGREPWNPCGTVSKPLLNQKQEQEQEQEQEFPPASRVPPAEAVEPSDPHRSKPKDLTAKDLEADGIDGKVAADWLRVRRAKKAPLTQTAWDGVKREAAAAGMTPAQAVRLAAENGWQGFKASWLTQATGQRGADPFVGAL